MLERNFLSHIKLALLLLLLFSSTVLQARLSGVDPSGSSSRPSDISIALASLQLAAALCLVLGGFWEYESGFRDMRNMRAFLVSTKPHLAIMTIVLGVVFTTCIVLLADQQEIG